MPRSETRKGRTVKLRRVTVEKDGLRYLCIFGVTEWIIKCGKCLHGRIWELEEGYRCKVCGAKVIMIEYG